MDLFYSMLIVNSPKTYEKERDYIFKVIFTHFFGLEYSVKHEQGGSDIEISSTSDTVKKLVMTDALFSVAVDDWLKKSSLPKKPLQSWDISELEELLPLVQSVVPIIYGKKIDQDTVNRFSQANNIFHYHDDYLAYNEDRVILGVDVFGSAFYMLTCYEEYANKIRDQHDRYPGKEALAYKEDFHRRPIINEYVEVLWWCMIRLWPSLVRKNRKFRIMPSHDVDVPFANAFSGTGKLMRSVAGDLVSRRSITTAGKRLWHYPALKRGNYKKDENYTFDRIMNISEKNNLKSVFFFKTGCTNRAYDNNYSIEHPYIVNLLREINERGHEIGLHTSYDAHNNPLVINNEFDKLTQTCKKVKINQRDWGVRQHYLRFRNPESWRYYAKVGLNYDSSVSFPTDCVGFKSGICYEYPAYDLEKRQMLALNERPLIVMEASLINDHMSAIELFKVFSIMSEFKSLCRKYNGDFTLLWHNNRYYNEAYWDCYVKVMGS